MSSPVTEDASVRKRKQLLLVAVVTVVILAAAGAFLMFGALGHERDREEILRTGKPADGTILDIEDTGNRFNDQPEVILSIEVRPPAGGSSYRAQARMILSPVYIPRFQPGAEVKLRAREKITSDFWTPIHPGWLRCCTPSLLDVVRLRLRRDGAPRLASRAPRRPEEVVACHVSKTPKNRN